MSLERIFGAVKPVRAEVGDGVDEGPRGRRLFALDLGALKGRAAQVRSRGSAGRRTLPAASRKTEPCIWPERPMALMAAGFSLAFLRVARVARPAAFHHSSGCCSVQPGLGREEAMRGFGGGQDFAGLGEEEDLGAGGADVDAEEGHESLRDVEVWAT